MVGCFTLIHRQQALVTSDWACVVRLKLAPSYAVIPWLQKFIGLDYFPTAPDNGCCGWRRGRLAKSLLIT
jgi:hypothetical protein